MGLTFKSASATSSTLSAGIGGTTNGSFLLAFFLCVSQVIDPAPVCNDSVGSVYTRFSQFPIPYSGLFNSIYLFWAKNAGSANVTATISISGSGGTYRTILAEWTGQAAGNPIAAAAGCGWVSGGAGVYLPVTHSFGGGVGTGNVPLPMLYTDLTSIGAMWMNPPFTGIGSIDSGVGGTNVVKSDAPGGWLAQRIGLKGPGNYTMTIADAAGNGNGGIFLVKSTVSEPIGAGLLLGVG